jgi:hypothetical protein
MGNPEFNNWPKVGKLWMAFSFQFRWPMGEELLIRLKLFFRMAKSLCPCRISPGNQGIRILPRTSTSPRTSIGVTEQTKTRPFCGSEWDQLMDGCSSGPLELAERRANYWFAVADSSSRIMIRLIDVDSIRIIFSKMSNRWNSCSLLLSSWA